VSCHCPVLQWSWGNHDAVSFCISAASHGECSYLAVRGALVMGDFFCAVVLAFFGGVFVVVFVGGFARVRVLVVLLAAGLVGALALVVRGFVLGFAFVAGFFFTVGFVDVFLAAGLALLTVAALSGVKLSPSIALLTACLN
jgi:hypothetical protein